MGATPTIKWCNEAARRGDEHGRDAPSLWKYNAPDKVPRVWHDLKAWRETLKTSPLWAERDDDDAVQKEYRARLRDLLGGA